MSIILIVISLFCIIISNATRSIGQRSEYTYEESFVKWFGLGLFISSLFFM